MTRAQADELVDLVQTSEMGDQDKARLYAVIEASHELYKKEQRKPGPHAHDFVDGVCTGCLKRQ